MRHGALHILGCSDQLQQNFIEWEHTLCKRKLLYTGEIGLINFISVQNVRLQMSHFFICRIAFYVVIGL